MSTVFITNPRAALDPYFGEKALSALRELALVQLNPHDRELSVTELASLACESEAVISYRGTPGTAELFSLLPRLKAFVRCATDIRNIDVQAASRHGILVTRTGAGFVSAVAEWVIGAMIDLSRNVSRYVESYRSGIVPAPTMGRELRGATLGVIGYGGIGAEVCRLARAFDMRILVTDPHRQGGAEGIEQTDLEFLLRHSDYVVCLAAVTPRTEHLLSAAKFSLMKRGAFFINASRGSLVEEPALLSALEDGPLGGCALDVGSAPDQMPPLALARHPRVIATPHIGGLTRPATEYQAMQTVEQVACILAGRLPRGAVNPEHASRCKFVDSGGAAL
jgi:D-3-phosphoglycerate dehydrogenase / 2-oxoglutarate reductase